MNKKIAYIVSAALLTLPLVTLADIDPGPAPSPNPGLAVVDIINKVLNFIWPIFVGFAVIMFVVAGFLFLTAAGEATKVASARQAILWGIIGVVVGILAFSIPFIVRNTLNIG
ncbi:MAG: hypothetical protein A3D44_03445 [Candidatus Staskawiczbacteria bacterium RIFCSPHIGHO2_02_FULL_42_22]|uniref:Conjugal transfer protein TrbC n=1 Tax=Candidatus Staskawiczbacteria bacterium RIFCSPHIGHO2_02_FULL_42_22 TaxID=1802207 RepID=A0A1G2I4N6_9BACT|nr:MAG: hypothetical protein A3D44_03445 [Candidatus Staskawiczbacteria bacterium RIFCSPHIGHO2_02_FULL_42_22]